MNTLFLFIFHLQWPIRHAIVEDWDLMVCTYSIFHLFLLALLACMCPTIHLTHKQ